METSSRSTDSELGARTSFRPRLEVAYNVLVVQPRESGDFAQHLLVEAIARVQLDLLDRIQTAVQSVLDLMS